jgi:hypothetical protein
LPNRFRHSHGQRLILFVAVNLRSFALRSALISIGQTILLGTLQRSFFDQHALTLIPLSRPAESKHDCRERTVFASTPR